MADVRRNAAAVIVAGGSGSRFAKDGGPPKQYRELLGVPLLARAITPFIEHPSVGPIVAVLPAHDVDNPPDWLSALPVFRVAGGPARGDSVRNGLAALRKTSADVVLIHDGARPFVSQALIDRVLAGCVGCGAIPGIAVTDTLKEIDAAGRVVGTPDRSRFARVQTPQAFPLEAIRDAHDRAHAEGFAATDDAALFERYGREVRVVEGDPDNIKVTVPADFWLAEFLASRLPGNNGQGAGGTSNSGG